MVLLSTKLPSCLVIMFCESVFFSAMLSMAINPDSLAHWDSLCRSTEHIRLCKSDRLYVFPSNHEKKSFNEGRRWCKQLAPCEELGDLIAIRDCDQLNDVVNLTNEFIKLNDIREEDVQVWTSRLRDLEHEQNLISSCKEKAKFDPQKTIDSNYSILEVETPRVYVRDSEKDDEQEKNQRQMGYVLCEILKPTQKSVCTRVIEPKKFDSKCLVHTDRKSTPKNRTGTTEGPEPGRDFDWRNIKDMIRSNHSVTSILKEIDDKFDSLMINVSIANLMETLQQLTGKVKADSEIFRKNRKEITSRYVNIFSSTLNRKHRSAWARADYAERKNASMEIILQLNDLIENNFCALGKEPVFDINPNKESKFKNRLKTSNIFLEAYQLRGALSSDFEFPNNLSASLTNVFGKNLIYFPQGLSLNEIDLSNPEMRCSNQSQHFATGVVYKNLAEYLHSSNASATKSVNLISNARIEDDWVDLNEDEDPKATNFSVDQAAVGSNRYADHVVNSELVAFTFNNIMRKSVKLSKPVRVFVEHLDMKERMDKLKCVYWDFKSSGWSEDGCRLVDNNRLYSICECDHLTNFAILMDISGRELEADSVKSAITMFCTILSIIGLLITIVVFSFIPKLKSKRNLITANLCFNLLVVNILVGFFMDVRNELACRLISIVLFYFLINSFCWMFIQGYFLYQMIVLVFSSIGYFRLKHMILYCNGFSLAWLVIVLLIIGPQGFYDQQSSYFCWFSDPNQWQKLWFFLAPVLIICIFNLAIIILSFKETYMANRRRIKLSHIPKPILRGEANSYLEFGSKSAKSSSKTSNASSSSATEQTSEVSISKIKSWFKGWLTLMLLLGLTWVIGFLMIVDTYQIASYVFILINSLQGFYIFLFEIALNLKSRTTIIKLIRDKLVVRYLIITKDTQTSTKTTSSRINPISSGQTTQSINDSGEEISSAYSNTVNVNRITMLSSSTNDLSDKNKF